MDWAQLRRQGQPGWGGATFTARMEGWQNQLRLWRDQLPPTGRVLELGCGNGAVLSLFSGYQLTGVDISQVAIDWAREKLPHAELYREDVAQGLTRFPDRHFDLVVDGNCLHCLLGPARPRALAAVRRVTQGVFLASSMCGSGDAPVDRHLAPAEALVDEISLAGFRPLRWRIAEHPWWSHLWLLAATVKADNVA